MTVSNMTTMNRLSKVPTPDTTVTAAVTAIQAMPSRNRFFPRKSTLWSIFIITLILLYILAFFLSPYAPNSVDFTDRLATPSAQHWFGTDHLGRDIATRVIYAAIWSVGLALLIASSGALIGTVIGLICGALAAFNLTLSNPVNKVTPGRFIDQWLMRITDSFFAFPELVAAVAISGMLGATTTNMVLALVLLSWMKYCRLVRSLTLDISQEDFVLQARLNGLPLWCILWRHILPNLRLQILVLWSNSWSRTILAISGLSFLGFGVQPPDPEWGAMLLDGKAYMQNAPHVMIFPGLAILITVLTINLLSDWVHDKLQQPSHSPPS